MKESGNKGTFRILTRQRRWRRQGERTVQTKVHRRNQFSRLAVLLSVSSCSVLLFFVSSCEKNSNPITPEVKLGKRNYTWTIDTIRYPGSYQTHMNAIWGSSPKDVWMAGWNGGWGAGSIYHFNGNQWEPVFFTFREGGPIDNGVFNFEDIIGFSEDTLWLVGSKDSHPYVLSCIYRGWRELKIPGEVSFLCVWGENSDNLWVTGFNGNIIRLTKGDWAHIPFDSNLDLYAVTGNSVGDIYVGGTDLTTIDSIPFVIKKWEHYSWSKVDSALLPRHSPIPPWGGPIITLVNNSFFGYGRGALTRRSSGRWEILLDQVFVGDVYSPNGSNIFVVGLNESDNFVYHWNGANWAYLDIPRGLNAVCSRIWGDGEELFILASDASTTYVLHGK